MYPLSAYPTFFGCSSYTCRPVGLGPSRLCNDGLARSDFKRWAIDVHTYHTHSVTAVKMWWINNGLRWQQQYQYDKLSAAVLLSRSVACVCWFVRESILLVMFCCCWWPSWVICSITRINPARGRWYIAVGNRTTQSNVTLEVRYSNTPTFGKLVLILSQHSSSDDVIHRLTTKTKYSVYSEVWSSRGAAACNYILNMSTFKSNDVDSIFFLCMIQYGTYSNMTYEVLRTI